MTFVDELRHVLPATDVDGAEIRVLPWDEAREIFKALMHAKDVWRRREWSRHFDIGIRGEATPAEVAARGTVDDQLRRFQERFQAKRGEVACFIRLENGVPTLIRLIQRRDQDMVVFLLTVATKVDYAFPTCRRALWDVGIRTLRSWCYPEWVERLNQKVDVLRYEIEGTEPDGALRMVHKLTERP